METVGYFFLSLCIACYVLASMIVGALYFFVWSLVSIIRGKSVEW